MEGIRLLKGKQVHVVATLNGRSAGELEGLADEAKRAGAGFAFNILDDRSYFLRHTSTSELWPNKAEITSIVRFLRDKLKRPRYELDYIFKYFSREEPCFRCPMRSRRIDSCLTFILCDRISDQVRRRWSGIVCPGSRW
jgi:hypothetical protein